MVDRFNFQEFRDNISYALTLLFQICNVKLPLHALEEAHRNLINCYNSIKSMDKD